MQFQLRNRAFVQTQKMTYQLEIVCKETIKPLSSTPPELRNLPLSLLDQLAPNIYIQLFYFFNNDNNIIASSDRGRLLIKDSLSKALTFYYPFAGRLRRDDGGNNFIDCNDMGASFLEAKLPCSMLEFMNTFDLQREEILKASCFEDMNVKDQRFKPLLSVQLTQFECGGEVMCVFCSHKVADMASLTNFMNDWASIARSDGDGDLSTVSPQFNWASFFRPEFDAGGDPSGRDEGSGSDRRDENVCCRRLVFEGSKIAALKAMVSDEVENPTRVQILAAFIYKAAVAAKYSITGCLPSTSLLQLINLRTRVKPPLPVTLTGNIISLFVASSTTGEQKKEKMELWSIVGDMKRTFEEFCQGFPKNYRAKDWASLYKLYSKEPMERWRNEGDDHTVYTCTSWCKFPLYDADFGCGKPVWITVPEFDPAKNLIILMDAKDGEGIEAMVRLEKDEMAAFEQNEELLSFCELKSAAEMLSEHC